MFVHQLLLPVSWIEILGLTSVHFQAVWRRRYCIVTVVSRMLLELYMTLLLLLLMVLLVLWSAVLTTHKLGRWTHVGQGLMEPIHRVSHGVLLDACMAHHPHRWHPRTLHRRIHRSCIAVRSICLRGTTDRGVAKGGGEVEVAEIEKVGEVIFRA